MRSKKLAAIADEGRLAAWLYPGQTTNFRTPGGGFAPVMLVGEEASQCLINGF